MVGFNCAQFTLGYGLCGGVPSLKFVLCGGVVASEFGLCGGVPTFLVL